MRNDGAFRTVDRMKNSNARLARPNASASWAWAFSALYDPFLWLGERTGVGATRKQVLGHARGRTVEIGPGTGLNLRYYPDEVGELILAEPDASMRSRLERRAQCRHRTTRMVDAPSERLPFADGSVDTVVSTFVLCTVDAPDLALREIGRILRPDGQLLFIEHVRSDSPTLAAWQDRLARPWRRFARGCRCNRATDMLIVASGLELHEVRATTWHGMPPIVRPLIAGRAHPEKRLVDGQRPRRPISCRAPTRRSTPR